MQNLKAIHHIAVSTAELQALSTWISSVQPAPPYLVPLDVLVRLRHFLGVNRAEPRVRLSGGDREAGGYTRSLLSST